MHVGDEVGGRGADDAAARDVGHVATARVDVALRGRAVDDREELRERTTVLPRWPRQLRVVEQLGDALAVVRRTVGQCLDRGDDVVDGRVEQRPELFTVRLEGTSHYPCPRRNFPKCGTVKATVPRSLE